MKKFSLFQLQFSCNGHIKIGLCRFIFIFIFWSWMKVRYNTFFYLSAFILVFIFIYQQQAPRIAFAHSTVLAHSSTVLQWPGAAPTTSQRAVCCARALPLRLHTPTCAH